MPVWLQYLEVAFTLVAFLVIGMRIGKRQGHGYIEMESDVISDLIFIGQTLRQERESPKIVGYLRDGKKIEFEVKMNDWVYLGPKTRIMGVERKLNTLKVLAQVYDDCPIVEHRHPDIGEGIKMLRGRCELILDSGNVELNSGDHHRIKPNEYHALRALPDDNGDIYAEYFAYWP